MLWRLASPEGKVKIMEKISINLLPIELRAESKKNTKQSLAIRVSVGILVLVIICSLGVLIWTFYLKSSLQESSDRLAKVTQVIQDQKDKEGLAVILKSRLDIITKLTQKESSQTESFNLITSLLPSDIKMLTFTVDKAGVIRLTAFTTSLPSMQTFFNNLTDPKKNEGKIISTRVESLNKNLDGNYNFELSISYLVKPQEKSPKQN